MKKLFLLDAFALIYRAHYAFVKRPMLNSQGLNVSAIFGFTSTLWEVLKKEQPSHIAVVFDLPTPTFRHKMYEEYKANRDKQPEDISTALPYIRQIVEAFNIPAAYCEGYEADDVIGTLAKQAEKEGFEVYMMTPDKDYAQLVSDKIFLYKPARMGNSVAKLGVPEVLEKWKIQNVNQVIDVLGLQGDASDNIPGVRGIGPKTATKLLEQYGSMEGIYENLEDLKGKQKQRLEEDRELAFLSKTLATIEINCPIQFDAERYQVEPYNREVLRGLFEELEFKTLASRILGSASGLAPVENKDLFGNPIATKITRTAKKLNKPADQTIETVNHTYHLVETPGQRAALVEQLRQQKIFCFDTETTGLNTSEAELVGLSFSWKAHEAYYVPIPVDQEAAQAIVHEFRGVFEDGGVEKVGQNIKYDVLMLRWYGVETQGKYWDTMLMHYVLHPHARHNLTFLSEVYLGYTPVPIEQLIGRRGKNQLTMRDVPIEKAADYAAEDADVTWQLYQQLYTELQGESELLKLYNEVEEPLVDVLVEMEYHGFNIDVPFMEEYSLVLEQQIKTIKEQIYKAAGLDTFNLDSPRQVGEVFFGHMGIPYRWRKTKTGQYSTNEEKLSELAPDHPVVANLLRYRSLAKLRSTYVDALPKLVSSRTGRLHTSFNQALTTTGRLSSQNPNLQNIPIRSEMGREVRKAFIPRDENHLLIAADYSQIELRLVAEISGDRAMLQAFNEGLDIHTATAARIYGIDIEEVTPKQRYNAKAVNFGIIYGAGATSLAKNLGIKRSEASHLIQQYFEEYAGIKAYMERAVEQAREKGYAQTLNGRRRYLRDIHSRNAMARSHEERNAINMPIQGTAADMIKLAMSSLYKALREEDAGIKMISQVHDELIFDVPKPKVARAKELIEAHMKNAMPNLSVPILVGIDEGENWLEAH